MINIESSSRVERILISIFLFETLSINFPWKVVRYLQGGSFHMMYFGRRDNRSKISNNLVI